MALVSEESIRADALRKVAERMLIAARTAPKGRGQDNMVLALMEGDDLKKISDKMVEIGQKYDQQFFIRDAGNILTCSVVVLLGTKIKPLRLVKCGMCGFENCDEKEKYPETPCVFNTGDLGIAIGSAVSVAMESRVDNRIMYTVGQAAMELGYFDADIKVAYGIPLSATAKSPFFDRK